MPVALQHTDSLAPAVTSVPAVQPLRVRKVVVVKTDSLADQKLVGDTGKGQRMDSADALPYTLYGTADSLDGWPMGIAVYREGVAKEIFGPLSTTASVAHPPRAATPSLTENTAFQGFVLLLAAVYAMLLYHNLGDIRHLLTRIFHRTASSHHPSEESGGSGFSRFLNTVTTIGMLFVGVTTVKYSDQLFDLELLLQLPHIAVLGLTLVVALLCMAVVFIQWLILRLVGVVTLSQSLISPLLYLKRKFFAIAVVIASPVLLLYALCPPGTGEGWFAVVVIELSVTILLYLGESMNLFISKKVSILHWFLYLCIVEIFPVSLIWLLVAR